MPDWVLATPLIIGLTYPFIKKKMWRWVGLIVIIAVYELILGLTGQTLSQEFWAKFSWRLVWILAGAWGLLLLHLAWKRLRKQ